MVDWKKIVRPILPIATIGIMAGCIISHNSDKINLPATDSKYRHAVEKLNVYLSSVSNGEISVDSAAYVGDHTIRFFYTLQQQELSGQATKDLIEQLDTELKSRMKHRATTGSHAEPLTFEYVYMYSSGEEAFRLRLPSNK